MRLLAGTSGFAFKEWKGPFYPERCPDSDMLGIYSGKFPTVEINNTFYRLPNEKVLRGWADQVPESFCFSIKASQKITHYARLKEEASDAVDYLLRTTSVLGERLGPILFQLPGNLKLDLERLRRFVDRLPEGGRYTMEFRHESWFDEPVMEVLRSRDIPLCVCEQADFQSPVVSTASWGYMRLHRLDYDDAALAAWAAKLAEQPWEEAFVIFKHDHAAGSGPDAVDGFLRHTAPA